MILTHDPQEWAAHVERMREHATGAPSPRRVARRASTGTRLCRCCHTDMDAEGWKGAYCPDCAHDMRRESADWGFPPA